MVVLYDPPMDYHRHSARESKMEIYYIKKTIIFISGGSTSTIC